MSWSTSAIGKAPAVAARIEKDFAAMGLCIEPEEGVKQACRAAIATALAAQDASVVVKVSASGHQSTDYVTNAVRNQLSVTIEPLYGFIE